VYVCVCVCVSHWIPQTTQPVLPPLEAFTEVPWKAPVLSVIIVARADDYGHTRDENHTPYVVRLNNALRFWGHIFTTYQIHAEVILVEWNPPLVWSGWQWLLPSAWQRYVSRIRSLLQVPPDLLLRIIQVPHAIHSTYVRSDLFDLVCEAGRRGVVVFGCEQTLRSVRFRVRLLGISVHVCAWRAYCMLGVFRVWHRVHFVCASCVHGVLLHACNGVLLHACVVCVRRVI
jgi:hypothetical protein